MGMPTIRRFQRGRAVLPGLIARNDGKTVEAVSKVIINNRKVRQHSLPDFLLRLLGVAALFLQSLGSEAAVN